MNQRPPWFREDLFPFDSHFVEINGCQVHYVDEGSGPTILMLHGNPTWSFLYRHVIAGLQDRFRCIALDYPGFGLSTAGPGYRFTAAEHRDVVQEFVRRLDLRDYMPMVQDWGGPIGISVAAREPERVAGLIVGNTWAWPMDDLKVKVFSKVLGGPAGHVLVRRLGIFTNVLVKVGRGRSTLTADEMAMYRGPHPTPQSRAPVHVLPREITAATDLLSETADRLHVLADRPALILWATGDPAFGSGERRRWEAELSNARTVVLEGAGHFFQDDAPDDVVAAVREWHPG